MSAIGDIVVVAGGAAAVITLSFLVVEARIRASEKRVDNLVVATRALGVAGQLLSELLDTLLASSEFNAGLLHRILLSRGAEIDPTSAMAYSATTMQSVRRVGHHIMVICGDSAERAEASMNLRGGTADARTLEVLRIAHGLHPRDRNIAAAHNALLSRSQV